MTDAKELAEHPRNLADRDFLVRVAKDIVADGDARGTAAKHSTTIWTRQVIEALIKAVETPANIGDMRVAEEQVEQAVRAILKKWNSAKSAQGHPDIEWAELAARALLTTAQPDDRDTEIARSMEEIVGLRADLDRAIARSTYFENALLIYATPDYNGYNGSGDYAARVLREAPPAHTGGE